MKVLNELFYSKEHLWVRIEDNHAYIGVTDYAQHELKHIAYVDLPEEDSEFEMSEVFGVIESIKSASDLYSPISCKVIEFNEEVSDDPELINKDAYESWLLKVQILDESQLEDLMRADEYKELCKNLSEEE